MARGLGLKLKKELKKTSLGLHPFKARRDVSAALVYFCFGGCWELIC